MNATCRANLIFGAFLLLGPVAFSGESRAEAIIGTPGPTFITEYDDIEITGQGAVAENDVTDYADTALTNSAQYSDNYDSGSVATDVNFQTGFIRMKGESAYAVNAGGGAVEGTLTASNEIGLGFYLTINAASAGTGELSLFQNGTYISNSVADGGYVSRRDDLSVNGRYPGINTIYYSDAVGSFSYELDNYFSFDAGVSSVYVAVDMEMDAVQASYNSLNTAFLNLILPDDATYTSPFTFRSSDAADNVPEPSSFSLAGAALAMMAGAAFHRSKTNRACRNTPI